MADPDEQDDDRLPSWSAFALAWVLLLACVALPLITIHAGLMFVAGPGSWRWLALSFEITLGIVHAVAVISVARRWFGRAGFEPRFLVGWARGMQTVLDLIEPDQTS